MAVLVTSDWHLNDKPRDRYRHDWVGKQLPKLIAQHKVSTLLMLGDLTDEFDNHSAALVNDIVEHLLKLCDAVPVDYLTIYLMRGNHDYVDPTIPFFKFTRTIRQLRWINSPCVHEIEELGKVLFLPHTRDYKTDWELLDQWFETADICFAHNTFAGTVSESGHTLGGIPLSAIPEDLPVVSGDIHKPQDVGHVTYVGSPYTVDFGDSFKPRVLLLRDGKMKSIPCSGPQKRLLVAPTADATVSQLKAAGDDIIKVRVTVAPGEVANWPAIKRNIIEEAVRLGVRLHAVEAVMDKPAASRRYKVSKGKAKRDDEVLKAYCSDRNIDQGLVGMGLEIIEAKG